MAGGMRRVIKLSGNAYDTTLKEAFDEFITEKQTENKAQSTIKNYKQSFRFFCDTLELGDNTIAKDITESHIYRWIGTLQKNDVSPSSQNHYLRDLRAFLYYAMDKEYLDRFKMPTVEEQEEQLKLFTDEELEKLLEKPARKNDFVEWRTWGIVNWVCATGNRAATVCDARIGDIDFTHREIRLHHTKNKKAQIIPLSPSLETAMREYIKKFRTENADGVAYHMTDYLFPNVGNDKLTYNALRQAFERYCEEREVSHSNIHGLRHNFAKAYIQKNGNIFKLQQILGHSNIAMTRRYVALFSEDLKEDFETYSLLDNMKKSQKRTKKV